MSELPAASRRCSVCLHPKGGDVDVALVRRVPYREIERRYGVSKPALSRHLNEHVAPRVRKLREEGDDERGLAILDEVVSIFGGLRSFLIRAEQGEDGPEYRAHAAEMRKFLELAAKVQGDLDETPRVNVLLQAEWIELKAAIVGALQEHPDALEDVLAAIEGASDGHA